jgi:hypothetical protein
MEWMRVGIAPFNIIFHDPLFLYGQSRVRVMSADASFMSPPSGGAAVPTAGGSPYGFRKVEVIPMSEAVYQNGTLKQYSERFVKQLSAVGFRFFGMLDKWADWYTFCICIKLDVGNRKGVSSPVDVRGG